MDVSERIKQMMEQRGWTIYRLGKESGLPQSTLSHIFRKDSEPTLSTLETICEAFNVTLCEFFSESDEEPISLTGEQRNILARWAGLSVEQKELVLRLIAQMK